MSLGFIQVCMIFCSVSSAHLAWNLYIWHCNAKHFPPSLLFDRLDELYDSLSVKLLWVGTNLHYTLQMIIFLDDDVEHCRALYYY